MSVTSMTNVTICENYWKYLKVDDHDKNMRSRRYMDDTNDKQSFIISGLMWEEKKLWKLANFARGMKYHEKKVSKSSFPKTTSNRQIPILFWYNWYIFLHSRQHSNNSFLLCLVFSSDLSIRPFFHQLVKYIHVMSFFIIKHNKQNFPRKLTQHF